MGEFAAGMAAIAFWAFVASCVVGGIWYAIRERQAQHETLRRIIESGRDVDAELIDRIMNAGGQPDRDLKIGGYITLAAAPGLVVLGWFLSAINDKVLTALLGVAGLVFFVGIGLLIAAKVAEPKKQNGNEPLV